MINVLNVSLRYGSRKLFEDVNIKFTPGNCYGVIGANGAVKSTFLKILAGEVEPNTGEVVIAPNTRMSVLKQDHYQYDDFEVLETVIMGNKRLYDIMKEKDALYAKPDFTDEDGIKASELEGEFAELNGWEAESEASSLLQGLGIGTDMHYKKIAELTGAEKVKVLLAQALFGNPGILILDEPTNHLDIKSIKWLQSFLGDFEGTVIVVSHDRHFLNEVCTHMADVDFGKIKLYVGNYDFWYESSQLAAQMAKDQNKKKEEKIKELASSIIEHGIIQPLVLRKIDEKRYEIVAGERRWRAARAAGLERVPSIIRDFTDEENMIIAIIENMQREDLNSIEEAEGLRQMIETYGFTQEEVSKSVSKSRPYITNALRLLKLPEKIQEKLANGQISPGHGRALLAAKDKAYQEKLCDRIINEGLSVRKTEELANHFKSNKAVKTKQAKDVNILQVERDLKEIYGTKISIVNKGKKGLLKIEYYGEDELNRLIDLLKMAK